MPITSLNSLALVGLEAINVIVEVDVVQAEKPGLIIVGLPDAAVKESKERVLAALRNSGFSLKDLLITINLAPSDLKKEGTLYDLPIAVGILKSLGHLKMAPLEEYLFVGELSLGGDVRAVPGGLAAAILAKEQKKKAVVLAYAQAGEAAFVEGVQVFGLDHLRDLKALFEGKLPPVDPSHADLLPMQSAVDFADIKGQAQLKRAAEIAAAGQHNLFLVGPPGSGKTMLARAILGILPEMSLDERLETTNIYSLAGLLKEGETLLQRRPFRSPHHTVSYAGLVGGGHKLRPGEVALAHQGVLFLDELPEFSRSVLEVLRQPLEDRLVTITRSSGTLTYPCSFLCIAAMNPCPCGLLGHPEKACRDTTKMVERYRAKVSAPLLDRFDLQIEVPAVSMHALLEEGKEETTSQVKERVQKARYLQSKRLGEGRVNGTLSSEEIQRFCHLDPVTKKLLADAISVLGLSARGVHRLLKVSRTIADLALSDNIQDIHLLEALSFRQLSH